MDRSSRGPEQQMHQEHQVGGHCWQRQQQRAAPDGRIHHAAILAKHALAMVNDVQSHHARPSEKMSFRMPAAVTSAPAPGPLMTSGSL